MHYSKSILHPPVPPARELPTPPQLESADIINEFVYCPQTLDGDFVPDASCQWMIRDPGMQDAKVWHEVVGAA